MLPSGQPSCQNREWSIFAERRSHLIPGEASQAMSVSTVEFSGHSELKLTIMVKIIFLQCVKCSL